jgi:hypothetical protein
MDQMEVVSVSDVLLKAGSNVHGNCSKAVLHQVPESETSLFSVNPGQKLAPHLHTRSWDLFFVVSGSGEIRYQGKGGAATVPMPARAFCAMPAGLRARGLQSKCDGAVQFPADPCSLARLRPRSDPGPGGMIG